MSDFTFFVVALAVVGLVCVVASLVVDGAQNTLENVRGSAMDRTAARMATHCELCNGVVYLCPVCREPITTHSHENDYFCETHGFVNPIRQHDNARINGDGVCSDAVRTLAK